MGLDIYLYKYENKELTSQIEEFENNYYELHSQEGDYATIFDQAKKASQVEFGEPPECENIQIPSKEYPDNLFQLGYFRSSYNESGINAVMKTAIGENLYSIFDYKDDYAWQPDWQKSLSRCILYRTRWEKQVDKYGSLRVVECRKNPFSVQELPKSKNEALEVFKNTAGQESLFKSFSSSDGTFYLDVPLKVKAFIPGKSSDMDCVYCVYESSVESYFQSLEIVEETCKFVLDQEDKDKYYLHWSG